MIFNASTVLLAAVCLGGAIIYVFATWKAHRAVAIAAKIAASTSFIVLAIINGATETAYGGAILVALIFSWLGDVLLLSRQSMFLLTGIVSFLVAHIAFCAAFVLKPVSIIAFATGFLVSGLLALL